MDTKALYKLSYGVYVVSTFGKKGKTNGQISNTVFQVTSEPAKIEIVINKLNLTHELIKESGYFGVTVLNTGVPMTYIGRFGFKSGREIEKFDGIDFIKTPKGVPIPTDYAVAHLECRITGEMDIGTHTVFIGEVTDAAVHSDAEPLTYAYYHAIKNGKEPATAPTFHKNQ